MENKIEKQNPEFNLEILNKLGSKHIELMSSLKENINNFRSDKDIYDFINNFNIENDLEISFPIGISINHIIAHNSYHENNLINLSEGDLITIDVGFIEEGNIIDAARTFSYHNKEEPKCINDCESYVNRIEDYIREQLNKEKKVNIQQISKLTEILVKTGGYTGLDFLGGHDVRLNKVHGDKLILNKPLSSLPKQAEQFINREENLGYNEMFCIEIFMSERFTQGQMIKSTKIPVTHYELNDKLDLNKLNSQEKKVYDELSEMTNNLAYYYQIHQDISKKDKKILEKLIKRGYIIAHEALEFKTGTGSLVKFVQHENTFIITKEGELINLTR